MNVIDCSVSPTSALGEPISALLESVCASLERFQNSGDHNAGHLEQALKKSAGNFVAAVLQKALQAKADLIPPKCPRCGAKLTKGQKLTRTINVGVGEIELTRDRGFCPKCQAWFCPADEALGIQSGHSPCVQELAALFASKMPLADAAAVMEIATGVKLPVTTLDRVAKQAAKKAQTKRRELDEQACAPGGPAPASAPPQTLIIQVDAWNIRERDQWGQSQELRLGGMEPERWHWVYTGTVFALEHRLSKEGRAMISSRGFVATRLGIDELREQLRAEAMRRGLGQALCVILMGDGAPWIWRLSDDRFPEARQRIDFYHVEEHLWAVAHELYPEPDQAQTWMQKIKSQLREGEALKIIAQLEEALVELPQDSRTGREIKYLKEHQERMDYGRARERGEPIGSGAIEATCRQYQCRFKRPGQFWSKTGDEGLLCLETFWRNGRWKLLFPHSRGFDSSKN